MFGGPLIAVKSGSILHSAFSGALSCPTNFSLYLPDFRRCSTACHWAFRNPKGTVFGFIFWGFFFPPSPSFITFSFTPLQLKWPHAACQCPCALGDPLQWKDDGKSQKEMERKIELDFTQEEETEGFVTSTFQILGPLCNLFYRCDGRFTDV